MAREAGVPFLFVSSTAFQSMYYGQTNRKIRTYFKALRKAAREEGGAIGFIEEIDAIAGARSGMRITPLGTARRVDAGRAQHVERRHHRRRQRAADPAAVVRHADRRSAACSGWCIDRVEPLAARRTGACRSSRRVPANILVIGATNRAADLDPALLRPGRFDRSIHFDLPSRGGRREIIDYYLDKKAHVPELDKEERRDVLAAMTFGYSPVMIEHLFDEALVWALRDGARRMDWHDIQQAKMTEEIGLKQPVEYTDDERRTIATHEAGPRDRRVPRRPGPQARGAVDHQAHATRSVCSRTPTSRSASRAPGRSSSASIQIAFGGMAAEELFFGESGTGPGGDLAHATTHRRADGRLVRHGRLAGVLRGDRGRSDHAGHRRQGARQRGRARGRSSSCSTRPRPTCTRCSTTTGTSSIALRDELLDARGARRRRDRRRACTKPKNGSVSGTTAKALTPAGPRRET